MGCERRVWLIRHGETEGQSSIRYHGRNDVPLSDEGRAQIAALAPLLAGIDFCRVVHSPLLRAAESATILCGLLGLADGVLRADERLREISFGDAEGMTREEIDAAFPGFWDDYEAGRTDAFPGGERRAAFADRVGAGARELARADWHGDLLLVAHRGTVKHAICALLGLEQAPATGFGVELASLSVMRETPGAWQLDLLGMRP